MCVTSIIYGKWFFTAEISDRKLQVLPTSCIKYINVCEIILQDGKTEHREPSVFAELVQKSIKAACFAFVVLKIQPIFDVQMNASKFCCYRLRT